MPAQLPAGLLKTPRKNWVRSEQTAENGTKAVAIRHNSRASVIRLRLAAQPPGNEDIAAIVEHLTGQRGYEVSRPVKRQTLDIGNLKMGYTIKLPDGRSALYLQMWRRRGDGQFAVSSYFTADRQDIEANIAEFKLVTQLNNQLLRGAMLVSPPSPLPGTEQRLAVAPGIERELEAGAAVPAPTELAGAPNPIPVAASPIVAPQPSLVPQASTKAATAGALTQYPFRATMGAGVPVGKIAAVVYAPLEFSEVYVLFKDGSFHENLPVALEEWDLGASRKGDPESWGKWKKAKDAGEFELRYPDGETVTIAGSPVPPAHQGLKLTGTYDVESSGATSSARQAIVFDGDLFSFTPADRSNPKLHGRYSVDGYTITLRFSDGREERRPFFMVPPEEADETPSIWFGDELRVKI